MKKMRSEFATSKETKQRGSLETLKREVLDAIKSDINFEVGSLAIICILAVSVN